MKITTEALRGALKTVAPAVHANPEMPSLASVSITADAEGLTFSTTDYQAWITTRVPCPEIAASEWSIFVSHNLASRIANVARAKEIDLERTDRGLRFLAGRSEWIAPGLAGQTPGRPAMPGRLLEIDAAELNRAVGRVAPAASDNPDLRPPLHVVQASLSDQVLTLVATNRYRAHVDTLSPIDCAAERCVYLEAEDFAKLASNMTGKITVLHDEGGDTIGLDDGTTTVLTRTIGVDKWANVAGNIEQWCKQAKGKTTVAAAELLAAIKAAAVTLEDGAGTYWTVSRDEFTISGDNDGASASVPVEEFDHEGPGLRLCLAPHVITAALTAVGDAAVEINWTRPDGALIIRVPGESMVFTAMALQAPGTGWAEEVAS